MGKLYKNRGNPDYSQMDGLILHSPKFISIEFGIPS